MSDTTAPGDATAQATLTNTQLHPTNPYRATGNATAQATLTNTQPPTSEIAPQAIDWDAYVAALPPDVQAAYTAHTAGLKTALAREREAAKALDKQVKAISAASAEDRDAKLAEMAAQLSEAQRRASFALSPEVQDLIDSDAAYTVMMAKGLFDGKGQPNWEAFRAAHPTLFKAKAPPAPPPAPNINGEARGGNAGNAPTFNGLTVEGVAAKYSIPLSTRK